uniref:Dendritic cell-specific transmembrane protein-like domain-containing protein n=2 Tax=Wuchereria bancrofti TaxID=6293 RepID=A0AAF5PYX2_WUCBA
MIESVGSKFFKSITETADDLGGRFEIAFTNFSNKITEDADILASEFISLSSLIKIVLSIVIILLLLIIFKYVTLGTLFLKNRWLGRHTQLSEAQFLIFTAPVTVEIESATLKKQYDSLTTVLQLRTATSDGQFLSKFLKEMKRQNEDQPS